MRINEWIEHLKTNCPIYLGNYVFGAAEMAVAKTNTLQTPCAFVIPMAENAKENTLSGGFSQHITVQVGIYLAVTNKSDVLGFAAHEELEVVREEVRVALCGWQPSGAILPVDFVAGQLIGYDDYTLRWSDVFTTSYFYRKVQA